MTDTTAFEMGRTSPIDTGQSGLPERPGPAHPVRPTTSTSTKPLLIIPPWINKYCPRPAREELDGQWATDQGHTTFIMSWVNRTKLAHQGFEDYVLEGSMAAINAVRQADRRKNQPRRLLPGRHAADDDAGLHGRQEGQACRSATFFAHARLLRAPANWGLPRRGDRRRWFKRRWPSAAISKVRRWPAPSTCCVPTT